jgi:hypothetical protein
MLDILLLIALIGTGFGLGYGVRELISRRRRHRYRLRDRPGDGEPDPGAEPANPKPAYRGPANPAAEAAGDSAIHLDRLLTAANDDRNGRGQRLDGQRVSPNRPRDEFEGAVQDLLGELNRRASRAE